MLIQNRVNRNRIIIQFIQHFNQLTMVGISLDLQIIFKLNFIIIRIIFLFYHIFITIKFKIIYFIQLSIGIQSMVFHTGLIKLFYLCIQSIILKAVTAAICAVFDIQMYKLGSQTDHLWNFFDHIISQFIAKTKTLTHMLIQIYGSLSSPGTFILLQLDFIIFLRIT